MENMSIFNQVCKMTANVKNYRRGQIDGLCRYKPNMAHKKTDGDIRILWYGMDIEVTDTQIIDGSTKEYKDTGSIEKSSFNRYFTFY